ncbi:MAG: GyrI-like domain-containing protein [Planctomycetes bacterium]|nr:GyrI-like domain-containing protein [Planctomycetota bacterium]
MIFPELLAPLCAAAVLLPSILYAQDPDQGQAPAKPDDPAVAALLAKMAERRGAVVGRELSIAAEGGYEVTFEGVKGVVAKGGLRELFAGATLARSTSDMGQWGAMEKGLHGDVVWEIDPQMGAKVLRGDAAAASRRYFAMLRGDDPRRLYRRIEKTGSEVLTGEEVTVLRMTTDDDHADTWYVAADGTVARIDTALPAPESADAAFGMRDLMDAQISFADWQQVDGRRYPKRRILAMGKARVISTWETVAFGDAIAPAKFALPEAVAKLKNAPLQPASDADGKATWQVVERQAQPVASIRVRVKASEIGTQLAILLPEVAMHLNAVGAQPAGPPFSRHHGQKDGEVDLEAGMPVQKPFEEKGRVKNGELPAGKAVTGWHVGPYDKLTLAHEALAAHLAGNKMKARGGVWEVYWTDPGMVPDPAKWKTQLFAPIE